MKTFAALNLTSCLLLIIGCNVPTSETSTSEKPSENSQQVYVDSLIEKGNALGARELSRMAAAELAYRNQPLFFAAPSQISSSQTGSFTKMYRNFTSHSIEDIYRSESYLFPVAYQIRFDYDLLTTPVRSSTLSDAAKVSKSDTQFSILEKGHIVRRYKADKDGNYSGALPDLPPRPDLYNRRKNNATEVGAAQPNRLPPSGPLEMLDRLMPISPTLQNLPPVSGRTF